MRLTRFAYLPTATLGELTIPNGPTLYTIERPWLNNQPFVSCIPTGTYPLEWDTTGRVRNVPRLRDTAPRSQINIHVANRAEELHGCIAPGMNWKINGQDAMVMSSREAMGLLLEIVTPKGGPAEGPYAAPDGTLLDWELQIVNFG